MKKFRSLEEKKSLVSQFQNLKASGVSSKEAISQLKITRSNYYDWLKQIANHSNSTDPKIILHKPEQTSSPRKTYTKHTPSSKNVMLLVGAVDEILDVIKRM